MPALAAVLLTDCRLLKVGVREPKVRYRNPGASNRRWTRAARTLSAWCNERRIGTQPEPLKRGISLVRLGLRELETLCRRRRVFGLVCVVILLLALVGPGLTGHKVLVIPSLAIAIFLLFAVWQWASGYYFPSPRHPRMIFILPLLFLILAIPVHLLFQNDTETATQIGFIYGLSSVAGLTISIAVLFTLRETFREELELMRLAAGLLRSVRRSLTFIVLTPNLGYARATYKHDRELMNEFEDALRSALQRALAAASTGQGYLKYAVLAEEDRDRFFNLKRESLKRQKATPETPAQGTGEKTYAQRTADLLVMIEDVLPTLPPPLPGDTRPLIVRREWKLGCIDSTTGRSTTMLPPLSILIADDHTAMVFYNEPLVTDAPQSLHGRVLRTREEVEAFSLLVDAYIDSYAQ